MSNPKELWREIRHRFDPFEPVRKPEWRAQRPSSQIQEISQLLGSDPETPYHLLVMGPTGSGKSTELLGVAREREAQEDCVIFLDVFRHFYLVLKDERALEKVSAWEVLLLIGLAMIQKGVETGIPEEDLRETAKALALAWENLAKASEMPSLSLDVSAVFEAAKLLAPALMTAANTDSATLLAVGTGAAVAATLAKAVKNWIWPMGTSQKTILDQQGEAQELLQTVEQLIQTIRSHTCSRRIVLIIDGLDLIRDIDRAEALMIDSALLTQLRSAALVITAPHALYLRRPGVLQTRYQFCYALFNEMVLDKHEPWKDGPGIATLLELYRKRTADLDATDLIHEEWLRYLAYYSAGHTRNFVRLIRGLADFATIAGVPSATEAVIGKTLRHQRLLLEGGLDTGDLQILQNVIADPERSLPAHEKVSGLLRDNRLLPYLNDVEWYFPHTLLMLFRLKLPQQRSKPALP